MRAVSLVLSLAIAGLLPLHAAPQSADQEAIRKLAADFNAAINKGDAKTAAALFTADGDYLSSTGRLGRGTAEIEKMVSDQAAGAFKGQSFKTTIDTIRMIRPDVAIASGTFESAARKGLATFVTVRDGGRWRIAALRAMVPPPPAK